MEKSYYVCYSVGTTVTIDIPEDADPEDYKDLAEEEAYNNVASPKASIEEVIDINILNE